VGPIKSQVEDWDRRLTLFSKTLEEWILCQKRWLYLKQIFSTPDIQRQLVQETKTFNQVCFIIKQYANFIILHISILNYCISFSINCLKIEKFWKELMKKTDEKPNALRAGTAPGLFENLQGYAVQMEKIQRSLEVKTFFLNENSIIHIIL
jgi:dynein heavy chain